MLFTIYMSFSSMMLEYILMIEICHTRYLWRFESFRGQNRITTCTSGGRSTYNIIWRCTNNYHFVQCIYDLSSTWTQPWKKGYALKLILFEDKASQYQWMIDMDHHMTRILYNIVMITCPEVQYITLKLVTLSIGCMSPL